MSRGTLKELKIDFLCIRSDPRIRIFILKNFQCKILVRQLSFHGSKWFLQGIITEMKRPIHKEFKPGIGWLLSDSSLKLYFAWGRQWKGQNSADFVECDNFSAPCQDLTIMYTSALSKKLFNWPTELGPRC